MAADFTTLTSSRRHAEVVDALVRAIEARGMAVFARFVILVVWQASGHRQGVSLDGPDEEQKRVLPRSERLLGLEQTEVLPKVHQGGALVGELDLRRPRLAAVPRRRVS
jgi:hypothetical protein